MTPTTAPDAARAVRDGGLVTGYVPIGNGIGAGIVGGLVHLVYGPIFAQIERERREGPLWEQARRGAAWMRRWHVDPISGGLSRLAPYRPSTAAERAGGIPLDWIGRPS